MQGEVWHNSLKQNLAVGQFCTYAHAVWRDGDRSIFHDHDFYEMFWVNEGTGYHFVNGRRLELSAGMLVLINVDDVHEVGSRPAEMLHTTNFAFFPATWHSVRQRYFKSKRAFFSVESLDARQYMLTPTKTLELWQAARDLEGGARDLFAVERFLMNALAILQSHWLLSEQSQTPRWLLQACEDIRDVKNFEGGTMMFATKIAGRSPAHVARACKKYLGTTPTEIVNQARMSYASGRLVMTDDAILNIALDCGFSNLGHFYRLFRKAHGFSPSAYRRYQTAALGPRKSPSKPIAASPGRLFGNGCRL